MQRTRRSLLASAAALTSLAGCLGGGPGGDENETTTTTTTTTSTTTTTTTTTESEPTHFAFGDSASDGEWTITPTDAHAQTSLFHLKTADQMGVIDPEGKRLLFVDLEVQGSAPEPDEFLLEIDGETYRGWTNYAGHRSYNLSPRNRRGQDYRTDEPTGWIGFEVPAGVEAEEAGLRLDRDESPVWDVPADTVSDLRLDEPVFEVQSIEVPETAASLETIPFSITVANTGMAAGTFRFVINYQGPTYKPSRQRVEVEAGETRTWETELDPYGTSGAESVRFEVATATENTTYTVELDSGSDT